MPVQPNDLFPNEYNEEDSMSAEPVANKDLTKAQLLDKLEGLEEAHRRLAQMYEDFKKNSEEAYKYMHTTLVKELEEKNKYTSYLERKIDLAVKFLTIEKGE